MNDEEIRKKYSHTESEEISCIKKHLLKSKCGAVLLVVAFVCLLCYKADKGNIFIYAGFILAVAGAFLRSDEKGKKLMHKKQKNPDRQVLSSNLLKADLLVGYYGSKNIATLLIVIWSVFVVGLGIYAYVNNGADYMARNWPGVVILMAGGWALYMVFVIFTKVKADKEIESIRDDSMTVLEMPVTSFYGAGKSDMKMITFKSEKYGAYEQVVSENEYYNITVGESVYYLMLRKTGKKYRLIKAYSADAWELDKELAKYLVKEVI